MVWRKALETLIDSAVTEMAGKRQNLTEPRLSSQLTGTRMTDQPMSGAQFRRHAGVDPERWARQFLQAYAQADVVRTDADRQAFVTAWFRDAMMEAAGTAEAAWVELAARRDRDTAG